MDEAVASWVAGGDPPAEVDVWMGLDRQSWDTTVSVVYQQELALLAGTARTEEDLATIRQQVVAERIAIGSEAVGAAVDAAVTSGARVLGISSQSGTFRVAMPGRAFLDFIAAHPEVIRIEQEVPFTEDTAGYSMSVSGTIDGIETADLLQSNYYYNAGYYGRTADQIGVVEDQAGVMRTSHPSFKNGSGTSRVVICGGTSPTNCSLISSVGPGGPHPTKVTSILVSDLTLGQDSAIAGATAQESVAESRAVAR